MLELSEVDKYIVQWTFSIYVSKYTINKSICNVIDDVFVEIHIPSSISHSLSFFSLLYFRVITDDIK